MDTDGGDGGIGGGGSSCVGVDFFADGVDDGIFLLSPTAALPLLVLLPLALLGVDASYICSVDFGNFLGVHLVF